MKKLISILSALGLSVAALGQQATNVQKGGTAGTNNLTADLNVGTGRTLTISAGGIFLDSNLTNGRVTLAGASGLLTDDADLTFSGDTLTATKFAGAHNGTVGATTPTTGAFTTGAFSTSVSTPSLITASGALSIAPFNSITNVTGALNTTGDITQTKAAGAITMNSSAGRPTIMVSSTGTAGSSTDTPVFRLNRFTNVMPSGANVGEIRFDGLTSVSSYTMPGYIVVNTTGASTATGSPSSMGFQTHNGTTNITSLSLDPNGASISTGTASTSTSTGALVLTGSGGLGVGGAIYAASVNATAGSLTTLSATGGIRIMTNNVYYAGTTTAAANQNLIGIGADDNTAVIAKSGQTLKMDVGASTIGTLSSTGLSVTGTKTNTYTGAGAGDIIQNSSDTSGTIFIAFNKAAGTAIGSVTRVTTTDAVAYNTTSDGDRKENIRDFTGSDSGPLIDALRPRWFDWKLDANDEFTTGKEADTVDEEGKVVEGKDIKTKRQDLRASHKARLVADSAQFIGFVAQEEDAADPVFARIGAVTRDANGVARARSDANLVPIIVAELQALRARVAALEAQNASFEARLDRATAQGVTP